MMRFDFDWNSFLFDNIGDKIKKVAKAIALFDMAASVIGGIMMILCALANFRDDWYLIFLAPIAVIAGCIVAWLSVILLYGFGELVDKACSIDQKLTPQVAPAAAEPVVDDQEAKDRVRRAAEERAQREAAAREKEEAEAQARAEAQKQAAKVQAIREAEERAKQALLRKPAKEKTLADHLAYALEFQSDDGMISYLKRLNDDMVTDILSAPGHLIRDLVKETLEKLQSE